MCSLSEVNSARQLITINDRKSKGITRIWSLQPLTASGIQSWDGENDQNLSGLLSCYKTSWCVVICVYLTRTCRLDSTLSPITWQFIIIIFIFTITTCIISYSFSLSFWTYDLAFRQILPTDSTDSLGPFNVFILLNGWICLRGVLD